MNFSQNNPRMPWYGYVIANVLVWIFVALIFAATKYGWFSSVEPTIDRSGIGSLLIFIPITFLLASIYDYLYDRVVHKKDDKGETEELETESELIQPGAESRTTKKSTP